MILLRWAEEAVVAGVEEEQAWERAVEGAEDGYKLNQLTS